MLITLERLPSISIEAPDGPMKFYQILSRIPGLNYPGKILFVAFVGIHVPLIALILFFALQEYEAWRQILIIVLVALTATVTGTLATMIVLRHLLKPIMAVSQALRTYRLNRELPNLPLGFSDEAGMLMRDTDATIRELDGALNRLTYFDQVSGLPNRARLASVVETMAAKSEPFSVVCVRLLNHGEIESFFDINTSNQVIADLAERLHDLDSATAVSRTGSDTFKFVLPYADQHRAEYELNALASELADPILCAHHLFYPRISIGVACYPDDSNDAATVMSAAMSAATVREYRQGSQVRFFSPSSDLSARRRFLMDQEIREALEREEFELHYQPIVDVAANKVIAAEALIRWRHPVHGMISPGDFIPVAEASGLIVPIGEWILNAATRQLALWRQDRPDRLRVSINISARQFRDPMLIQKIDAAITAAGIRYQDLKLEITETVLITDLHVAGKTIAELRERGAALSLDDFGADYSNMRYLANFAFDEMKVDRLFVSNIDEDDRLQAICTSLITLSEGLGLPLVAEGVERDEELAMLRSLGCRLFQGYRFSPPVPATAFLETSDKLTKVLRASSPTTCVKEPVRLRTGSSPQRRRRGR